jgi:transposase
MTGKRRQYTSEFKREAIRLYETSGKSVRQIEADLDITPGLLNKWRTGHQTDLEAELRRLKRENEVLRQGRDILTKAIQVLGKDER